MTALTAHPAQPTRQTWTLVLASLGAFMTALDTLVVTTALPVLRSSLHGSLSDLEWTVNAYNLCFACSLLTGAALGDRFGRRRMYAVGLAVHRPTVTRAHRRRVAAGHSLRGDPHREVPDAIDEVGADAGHLAGEADRRQARDQLL
ncbi:MFS transporter [Streptomyces sp. NRRL WC-3742]|uniref:MFS transporter n=1 Tax=Streptomyces sp. NRRL WC-3742 TaxID=1463934 RepID=UPI0004CB504C